MGLFRRRRDAYDDLDPGPDAPAEDEAGDLHDAFDDDQEDEEPGGAVAGAVSKVLAAVVVSGVFAAAILYAYSWSVNDQGPRDENLPVVEAEPGPEKVKPEDPGGMDVPYQDQLVLNQNAGDGEVEQLLPPPEEPRTAETGSAAAGKDRDATAGSSQTDRTGNADGTQAADHAAPEPGEQVASTEPSRTPEETAETDAGTRTAEPDQDQATSGETGGDESETDSDTVVTGETGAEETRDTADTSDTAARTDRTGDGASASGGGTYLVQLAAFQNRDNAEKAWQRIQDKHKNVLGNQKLQLQRKRIPDKGIFWRVRTGPFPNRATADDLCGQLKDRGQPCLVMER